MRRLGIEPGKPFDSAQADPVVKRAIDRAPAAGMAAMKAKLPTLARVVNGWQMNTDCMGVYGTWYLKRAIVAMVGLGANLPEDAIYPLHLADAEGKPIDGTNAYRLSFRKDELPPADFPWPMPSIVMPSAIATRWSSTPTAHSISSSRPSRRGRARNPTGCRRPRGRST
jgi:hypothetical protein